MLDRNKRKALMWSGVALFVVNGVMNGYFSTSDDSTHDDLASGIPSISLIQENSPSRSSATNTHKVDAAHEPAMAKHEAEHKTEHEPDMSHQSDSPTASHAPASHQVDEPAMAHLQVHPSEASEHGTPSAPSVEVEPMDSAHEPEQPHSTAMAMVCYQSGPFVSRAAAKKMQKAATGLHLKTNIKKQLKKEKLGFWVYLKPERSLSLSRLKAEEVKAKGIQDVAVVIKSKPKYAISLGVFKNKKTAEARKIKAEALGFKPLLTTRYNSETQYWVQMQMSQDKEPNEEQWRGLIKGKKGIEIKPMECKS